MESAHRRTTHVRFLERLTAPLGRKRLLCARNSSSDMRDSAIHGGSQGGSSTKSFCSFRFPRKLRGSTLKLKFNCGLLGAARLHSTFLDAHQKSALPVTN